MQGRWIWTRTALKEKGRVEARPVFMPRLFLIGDSTCAIKRDDARPETGWGECFQRYVKDGWVVDDRAINGRSTKQVLENGEFSAVLNDVSEGDAVLIQFGHNDSKAEDPSRYSEPWHQYLVNLVYMAEVLGRKGAAVYFATSIARRKFEDGLVVDTHHDFPAAMKAAAMQASVPCIDMTYITMVAIQRMGEIESKKMFMNFERGEYPNYPEGKSDDTHLRREGAEWIASLVYRQLSSLSPKPSFLI